MTLHLTWLFKNNYKQNKMNTQIWWKSIKFSYPRDDTKEESKIALEKLKTEMQDL